MKGHPACMSENKNYLPISPPYSHPWTEDIVTLNKEYPVKTFLWKFSMVSMASAICDLNFVNNIVLKFLIFQLFGRYR
jgi:hypothetical protein